MAANIDLYPKAFSGWDSPIYITVNGEKAVLPLEAGIAIGIKAGYCGEAYESSVDSEFDIVLKINDVIVLQKTDNVEFGSCSWSTAYTLSDVALDPGTYTLSLTVDANNDVEESNETNNVYTATLTVSGCTGYFVKTCWDQDGNIAGSTLYENDYVPIDPSDKKHCVTSCVNTAFGQIINYYFTKGNNFTLVLDENDAYTTTKRKIVIDETAENADQYGYLSFAEVNSKLSEYDPGSAEDIAALLFACGVVMQSDYTSSSTSTYTTGKILDRIGFESYTDAYSGYCDLLSGNKFTDAGWNKIIENMKSENPVLLSLANLSHAVIADGYNAADETIHLNFGWGILGGKRDRGSYSKGSGWYSRAECDAFGIFHMICDITPDKTAPVAGTIAETKRTKNSVTVSASFTDNVEVWKTYYRIDAEPDWHEYTNPVVVTKSSTIYFKAEDKARNTSAISSLSVTVEAGIAMTCTGNFTGKGAAFQLMTDGTAYVRSANAKTKLSGSIDTGKWELVGADDFNGSGKDGLLWLEKSTGYVYMQHDMTGFAEVNNKTNCLGVLGEGYSLKATGDFTGNNIAGALLQGPAFGDETVSLNYGLPVWARNDNGSTFNGWLGALVNTWQKGDPLKGDLTDPASINANNYQYEVVGVGDFNGDGVDDVMLQNTMPEVVTEKGIDYTITGSGDVFTFLTGDKAAIIAGAAPTVCYAGCATDGWEILGFGDFDADGIDDALLSDGTGLACWKMSNGQRQDNFWFGNLSKDEEFAGIADFNNDGTDDILIRNTATETLTAWTVKDGVVTGTIALK